MHYRGTIWRPPFEAHSVLLQITSGCTHNKCKFCSLYDVDFKMSPMSEIEEDLREVSRAYPKAKRVFMTGANPFVLSFDKIKNICEKIHQYLPNVQTIGGFARITDIMPKTNDELAVLRSLGINGISIGTETGDDDVLSYMNKGVKATDIITQCKRLEKAKISYNVTYLTGLAGKDKGEENAVESAKVYNFLNPESINIVALTIFPNSELYSEINSGKYTPESEKEKLQELYRFVEDLKIETIIYANTISNTAPFVGKLPKDKAAILERIKYAIDNNDEHELESYRKSIHHL